MYFAINPLRRLFIFPQNLNDKFMLQFSKSDTIVFKHCLGVLESPIKFHIHPLWEASFLVAKPFGWGIHCLTHKY